MNVLVLGADGYSGTHLVKSLLERGHTVRGLVRDLERGAALEKQGMDMRVGDIRQIESVKALAHEIQVIFNLIGYCRDEPAESKTVLLDGTRNLRHLTFRSTGIPHPTRCLTSAPRRNRRTDWAS
jgi:nucleoside-diphosphate-sugar epimerase